MPPDTALPPGPRYPVLIQGVGLWTRPLAYMERCRERYGKRFTIRFPFTPPFVMITEPEQVKQIFMAPPDVLHPGEGARVLQPIVGHNSVILLDGDAHMEQRKLILPAFHGEKMARLADLVESVTEEEIAGWGGVSQLHPRLQALTLEIILRAVFGLDPGPRLDALRDALARFLAFGDHPMTLIPPPSNPETNDRVLRLLSRAGPLKGFMALREQVDGLIFEQINERRRDSSGRDDVLAMLLAARHEDDSPMTDQELRDELMTLLVAGHETTASSLAWGLERLSREPAVAEQLTAEGDDDAYLTATIQEVLRRRPVLPNAAPRLVKQAVEVGEWSYPPGVALVPCAYLIHHDADVYDDPYAFRPERFLDSPPGTYTWIPFGGGRRRCIGMSFAMLEMKIVMRSVVGSYEICALTPGGELPRRRNITIRPGQGARLDLRAGATSRTSARVPRKAGARSPGPSPART